MTIEKNDQLANIQRPFLKKDHISCAYATCSYSVWEKGAAFMILKFQFGELQMTVVSKWHSSLQPPTSQKVMLLAVNR
jgi:hypothetical protein